MTVAVPVQTTYPPAMPALIAIPDDLLPTQAVVARLLEQVEARIEGALTSDLPPVQRLVRHVERYRGKMVRPTLVALCALACSARGGGGGSGGGNGIRRNAGAQEDAEALPGALQADLVTIAAVCEMIHLATLVHDDVLDEADTRRKSRTVNALHGNETAVILGDYLFSTAYHLCSTLDTSEAALLIGATGMTLCTGELLQLHHREDFSLDEPTYFEIVRRKTASLIAAACRLGASRALRGGTAIGGTALQSRDAVDRLEQFGYDIGVAFQIQDDLLDLTGEQSVVGKSLGKDAEKGKLTLPVIHHLATADPVTRGRTLSILDDQSIAAAERSGALVHALRSTDSVAHARATAESLVRRAQHALNPLPDTPAKQMLLLMADTVITRAF